MIMIFVIHWWRANLKYSNTEVVSLSLNLENEVIKSVICVQYMLLTYCVDKRLEVAKLEFKFIIYYAKTSKKDTSIR